MSLLSGDAQGGIVLLISGLYAGSRSQEAFRELQLAVEHCDQERGEHLVRGALKVRPRLKKNANSLLSFVHADGRYCLNLKEFSDVLHFIAKVLSSWYTLVIVFVPQSTISRMDAPKRRANMRN